tara:strand:+ start:312 stop:614 length:303 start_codon:yes stop_codon:yes gene_type:complete
MPINDFIKGAIVVTEGNAASGSFAKLQCVSGSKNTGNNAVEVHFETISFGIPSIPESAHTASSQLTEYTHSLGAGFDPFIQGPIARFKVDKGEVLAYFTR